MPKTNSRFAAFVILSALFLVNAQNISITGTVVDSSTSQAIAGASVNLVEVPQITTITGSDGKFTLAGNATASKIGLAGEVATASILLHNTDLVVTPVSNQPIVVDVFGADGRRIAHAQKTGMARQATLFRELWSLSSIAYVNIHVDGCEHAFAGFGGVAQAGISVPSSDGRLTSLGKSAATYTLQVAASTYTTKNVALSSATVDAGTIRLVKNTDQTGVWTNVTPSGMDISGFGAGYMVVDPIRPSDYYVSGSGNPAVWKSADFGKTWSEITTTRGIYSIAIAHTNASTPATLWMPSGNDDGTVQKSTDGGSTWRLTGGGAASDLYSIQVDPNDPNHLISGLHELNGIQESTDGGETWKATNTDAGMSTGASWFPFFINTGNAATTRTRWLAVPQPGSTGSWLTADGGATWTKILPNDHPHGNCQIYQSNGIVFLGVESHFGSEYDMGGVYRSTDLGATWTHVNLTTNTDEAIVWGTPTHVYAMYGWAAGSLGNFSPNFQLATQPATSNWDSVSTPTGMVQGANSMGVSYDGTHYVFVGSFWLAGIWRYVEP